MSNQSWFTPDWPAPRNVKALSTTRMQGVSVAPYDSNNLGAHVGDDEHSVKQNRLNLRSKLPSEPLWLNQVHGVDLVDASEYQGVCDADGAFAHNPNQVCTVMTADCLPVLFCNAQGTQVAAAHAGWRGLLDGILEQTVARFEQASSVMAWLGPAIGPTAFEVGEEVKQGFCDKQPEAQVYFKPTHRDGKWLADLYGLARFRLSLVGVTQIYGGEFCTFTEPQRFFSYRRDGVTGRMASCIWLAD
ncbi:peptidoglycan editing factor PgeF [Oceaniserpentilla sp. 4NH20-0058]|uniref:peptidoglycan editing factor PgeF n=1 Tax=Oceaniserpentilla sp. 4NH20-0058 TaxID=3127660 RepID=UPI003109F870